MAKACRDLNATISENQAMISSGDIVIKYVFFQTKRAWLPSTGREFGGRL
jgi:hypothetical protein